MSKKKLVLEVITETLESINEENEIIQKYTSTIPQIELDLILENIRKLYANYRLIDKYNLEESEPRPAVHPISIGFEIKKTEEPESGETVEELVEIVQDQDQDQEPEPEEIPEEMPEEIPEEIPQEIPEEVKPEEPEEEKQLKEPGRVMMDTTPPKEKPVTAGDITFDLFGAQVSTIADKYRKEENTVNEQLRKETPQENIASKIRKIPISELKSVIGLNDKFIFINELFHGNMKAYQETIQTLDQLTNLNDAIRHLTEIKETFDMNEDLESFKKMVEFIQRKFKG
jgi:hypothetical protein